jgi:hypothetical protein
MKSEKLVLESACRKIEKLDLIPNIESSTALFDLLKSQPGFRQQRFWNDVCRLQARAGEPRYAAHCGWERAEASDIELAMHEPMICECMRRQ